MNKIVFALLLLIISVLCMANESTLSVVAVGEARRMIDPIHFVSEYNKSKFSIRENSSIQTFATVLQRDFSYYVKRFSVVVENHGVKTAGLLGSISYDNWFAKKARYLIIAKFSKKKKRLKVDVELHDIFSKKEIMAGERIFQRGTIRKMAHEISNEMYKAIVGKESIFNSQIIFVSDMNGGRRDQYKDLYIMDFDGKNIRRLTNHKGTVISPAISQDRRQLLYSLIKGQVTKKRNINLYLYDIKSGKPTLISSRRGLNSGAVFMPDGKNIALTLSHTGNSEIYLMNLKSKRLTRVTKHFATDVDPSISADGKLMAMLSDRPGKAMIYTINPAGTERNVKRVSYVGQYNATPRFSPDGKQIVFASWLDERFDIFRINSDGSGLSRLTKNFGSNEDPTYSNDGEFIAFSSQRVLSRRKAVHNIYIMDKDGEIIGSVTKGNGNCITPRWTKSLK